MKNVKGNLIVNTLTSQIAEAIAFILSGIVVFKIGPRPSIFVSYLIAVLGSIGLVFVLDIEDQ